MTRSIPDQIHMMLTGEDDGRVCRDIPEEACAHQPRNFLVHVISLTATKAGDGLSDPKLVLSWLLTTQGAPAGLIGLLVPIRESGSLLPQLFTAGFLRRLPVRKWAWCAGSIVQGICVGGMALAALRTEGSTLGWTIAGLLAVFSIARSVCSVTYKDVLGKTVSKSTRGTATGTASGVAAAGVLGFGVLLSLGVLPMTVSVIAGGMALAAWFWIVSAILFATLTEVPGATEGGGSAWSMARQHLSMLATDRHLLRFIAVRGLLVSTALAPPFILSAVGESGRAHVAQLGPFVMASSLAAVLSTYLWGRLADRSSRRVLIFAGLLGSLVLAGIASLVWFGLDGTPRRVLMPVSLFALMIAYQGVRLGRSTHLVDMADPQTRAPYTALSNTVIGVVLLGTAAFAWIAQIGGVALVLALFAGMSALGAWLARGLDEVQQSHSPPAEG